MGALMEVKLPYKFITSQQDPYLSLINLRLALSYVADLPVLDKTNARPLADDLMLELDLVITELS
jgi:acetoacetate decarboxylase